MLLRPGANYPTPLPTTIKLLEIQNNSINLLDFQIEIQEEKLIIKASVFQEENWRENFFQLLEKIK